MHRERICYSTGGRRLVVKTNGKIVIYEEYSRHCCSGDGCHAGGRSRT